jgi:glutamine synthetase
VGEGGGFGQLPRRSRQPLGKEPKAAAHHGRHDGHAEVVPRVPSTLVEAIAELEGSELAAKAFGEDVQFHLVNTARQEWVASNRVVTDWEMQRSF